MFMPLLLPPPAFVLSASSPVHGFACGCCTGGNRRLLFLQRYGHSPAYLPNIRLNLARFAGWTLRKKPRSAG